jgi:hypothetical protein
MSYPELSKEFKAFKKLRDEAVTNLEKCDFILMPSQLEESGFECRNSEYFSEGIEEHEFHQYQKGDCHVTYLESYVEREGGLYFQSFYATAGCIEMLRGCCG